MKRLSLLSALIFCLAAAPVQAFTLSSPQLKEPISQEQVFNGFGCTGGNISPELIWTDPPAGTKSFLLTAYDPDAPTGSGWWHWVVFNIPAEARSLPLGAGSVNPAALPAGAVQSLTDFGAPGYGGPCPPAGDKPHRYIFRLAALNTVFDLPQGSMPALVGFMASGATIGEAVLEVKFGR